MNPLRRLLLVAGVLLLSGVTTGCSMFTPATGETAAVSRGPVAKTIVTIGSMSVGDALIPLDQPFSELVKIGQPVDLSFESVPGLHMAGTVKQIVPIKSSIAQKTIFHANVQIATPDPRVRAGQYVRAAINVVPVANALVVPNAAVKSEGQQTFVTDPNGDRKIFIPGAVGDEVTEVKEGLSDGQRVRLLS